MRLSTINASLLVHLFLQHLQHLFGTIGRTSQSLSRTIVRSSCLPEWKEEEGDGSRDTHLIALAQVCIQDALAFGKRSVSADKLAIHPARLYLCESELVRVEVSGREGASELQDLVETPADGGELVCDGHELFADRFRGTHQSVDEAVATSEVVEQDL